MAEKLAERFRESRHRWLIVTAVTFVIALATALPQVDQLLADRSERAELQEQLAQAARTIERLPDYRERVDEITGELETLRDREVDQQRLATLRSWLVTAARDSGCQVRRIDLAAPDRRPWSDGDHPLEAPAKPKAKTPFELQTRSVSFSVTGSETEVYALLRAIDGDNRLKHTHSLELKPLGRAGRELQLDLTLWYFALAKADGVA